jgi:hypothetical protein
VFPVQFSRLWSNTEGKCIVPLNQPLESRGSHLTRTRSLEATQRVIATKLPRLSEDSDAVAFSARKLYYVPL